MQRPKRGCAGLDKWQEGHEFVAVHENADKTPQTGQSKRSLKTPFVSKSVASGSFQISFAEFSFGISEEAPGREGCLTQVSGILSSCVSLGYHIPLSKFAKESFRLRFSIAPRAFVDVGKAVRYLTSTRKSKSPCEPLWLLGATHT